ncbi:3-hydroxyisobutyrate [Hyphodiscus hymeniophilus]|uniref:3-hydroxyisobutyrate dehydrogenase n=1 Tax=Hyphodiscus hymeniophilus TaxID=353542 RepID=A0A9P6VM45_9HELO|nr:3-hydroxyisobutyrate [Hyphodiscus hymeniophilus]
MSNHSTSASQGSPPPVTYGFIGLGVMGFGMAQNLRAKLPEESTLVICEIVEKRRDQFMAETQGLLKVASSPKEVAEQADIIITMLPKGPHVLDAFTNPSNGLLTIPQPPTPKFFIECSTIDVKTSLLVADKVKESGLGHFVDSPVSGGPNGAIAGTLTFMVGGTSDLFERTKAVVRTMGKEQSIFHCGPAGAGLATKQINNYLSAVCILGVSEAMNMGIRYGLDPKVLSGVINVSSGKCYNSLDQNPVKGVTPTAASAKDFEGGFSTELCKGVVDMAVGLGKEVGAKSVLSDIVQSTFQKAMESEKCSGKDCRSVYRLFAEDDGLALD